jgi:DNA phosphorothioation-associated putative methyltransferase
VDEDLSEPLREAERLVGLAVSQRYNVIRFDPALSQLALLHYSEYFEDPFPVLQESWRVDLATGEVGYRTYEDSLNPPILHRKELLLPEDHPRQADYAALTEAAEAIGLFDYPTRIGYRRQWERLVREKGYRITGHELVPIGNDEAGESAAGEDQGPFAR